MGDPDDDFLPPGGALRGRLFAQLVEAADRSALPQAGDRVGPFRVLRPLGEGGMGAVFLAERADGAFAQQVALKCLRPQRRDLAGDALLVQERALLAGLDHPNIARLIDGGSTTDGMAWFAMEYVEGLRLDVYARERRLAPRARVGLLVQLCAAVGYAHRRLVVHRDIKPGNILVTPDGWVKLLDFGIASLVGGGGPGALALTPTWASPEQRDGGAITTASDVFQLGRVLRHLVAVRGMEDLASTRLEATRHAREAPPPRAQPEVPLADPDLEAIAARACAPAPESRYPSVDALGADLEAWLARRPVAARRSTAAYRLRRFVARHPWGVAAAVLVALLLAALGVQLAQQRDMARRSADRAGAEALRAQSSLAFIRDMLGAAQPAVHRGKPATVEFLLERASARALADTAQPAAPRGELLAILGSIHLSRGAYARARELFEAAIPLLRDGGDVVRRAEAIAGHAYALDYAEVERSLPAIDEALALLPADRDDLVALRLQIRRWRASIEYGAGRRVAAQAALDALLAECLARYGPDHVETAQVQMLLTYVRSDLDRVDEALQLAVQANATLKRALGADHPTTLQAGNRLVAAYYDLGRFAEQEQVSRELIDATATVFGDASPRYARALTWHAGALVGLGRGDEALPLLRQALGIYDANPADDDLGSPNTLSKIGDIHAARGEFALALDAYERARDRARERPGAVPADTGEGELKPARMLLALGRPAEAAPRLAEAWRLSAALPDDAWLRGQIAATQAELSLAGGDVPRARACATQALAILRRHDDAAETASRLQALLDTQPAVRAAADCFAVR